MPLEHAEQRYKIVLVREPDGHWKLYGYWEIDSRGAWQLDGAPMGFNTRKEALEYLIRERGIPE